MRLRRLARRLHLRRAPEVFGLDLGSAAVKVVQLRKRGSGHAVRALSTVPIVSGAIAEGSILDPGAAVEAVRIAVEKAGVTTTNAAIGLCGRELIIKKLQIPEVPPKELPAAVQLEAEHQIPFAIDDVFLDYHVMSRQNRSVELALVAAKKSKVMEYRQVALDAGLDPVVVDVDGFALGNQHELSHPGSSTPVALVDIGATMTTLSIVRAGLTLFVRDVPFGGQRYTQGIAARLQLPVEQAEAIKRGLATCPDPEALARARDAVSRDLALELQRAFDYFASSAAADDHIATMILAGGGARLAGLPEYLATAFGVPVELARPLAGIQVDPEFEAEAIQAGPSLAVAVGLSLRLAGEDEDR